MTTMRSLDDSVTRELPANNEAEKALIGAVLVNNDAFRKVSGIVEAAHFYERVNRQIWEVASAVIAKGQLASPITLKTYLGNADLGGVTVMEYLAHLAASATTVINAPDYARTVRDLALRRRLISIGQTIASTAFDAPVEATAESIWADLERELETERPAMTGEQSDFCEFGSISSQEVFDAYQHQTGLVGHSTGLSRLDAVLGGLQPTDLIVIAGRPAMGKTALATGIAVAVARHVHARLTAGERLGVVGFSSLEMGKNQLKQRILADLASVPSWKLKRGIADQGEMARYINAEREFRKLPLFIDPTGGLTIQQIKLRARGLKKRRGLSLLVVDYLQLLSAPGGRSDNRTEEVRKITAGLKELAKELEVPVIALSQLNRDVEKRDDMRPKLSDLKESGSIEQDADSVLFVYREEYYLSKRKPRDESSEGFQQWQRDMRRWGGVAEVIVGKNRHGAEDTATLGFQGEFTRFTNEPSERTDEPEQARQRAAKKPTLPKESSILYGVLKSLTIARSYIATQDQRSKDKKLCKGARMIELDVARNAFLSEVMPGEPFEKVKPRFQKAFIALRDADLARYHAPPDDPVLLWLPEMVAEL